MKMKEQQAMTPRDRFKNVNLWYEGLITGYKNVLDKPAPFL